MSLSPCLSVWSRRCLLKFYQELPPQRTETGTTVLDFECPSCRLICQCAACRKRQQQAEEAAAAHPSTSPPMTSPPAIGHVKTPPAAQSPPQSSPVAVTVGAAAVLHPAMQPLDEAHGAPAMGTEVVAHSEEDGEGDAQGEGEGETETEEMSEGGAEEHSMGGFSAAA